MVAYLPDQLLVYRRITIGSKRLLQESQQHGNNYTSLQGLSKTNEEDWLQNSHFNTVSTPEMGDSRDHSPGTAKTLTMIAYIQLWLQLSIAFEVASTGTVQVHEVRKGEFIRSD